MYRGVKIGQELHAHECCRHVSQKSVIFSKIRNLITQALTIYKSMILPNVCYGHVILHPKLSPKTSDKIQRLHNEALQICQQRNNSSNVNNCTAHIIVV